MSAAPSADDPPLYIVVGLMMMDKVDDLTAEMIAERVDVERRMVRSRLSATLCMCCRRIEVPDFGPMAVSERDGEWIALPLCRKCPDRRDRLLLAVRKEWANPRPRVKRLRFRLKSPSPVAMNDTA